MIANETLIGTLMKTEILTNNYTINKPLPFPPQKGRANQQLEFLATKVQFSNLKIQSVG